AERIGGRRPDEGRWRSSGRSGNRRGLHPRSAGAHEPGDLSAVRSGSGRRHASDFAGYTGPWWDRAKDQRRCGARKTHSIHASRGGGPTGGPTMTTDAHLWAIGYDDVTRADQVRDKIIELGWGAGKAAKYLILEDIAVVVRNVDGSFTFD